MKLRFRKAKIALIFLAFSLLAASEAHSVIRLECPKWFTQLVGGRSAATARSLERQPRHVVLEFVDPENLPAGRTLVSKSESSDSIQVKGRMATELHAKLVVTGGGKFGPERPKVLVASPEEVNKIWDLDRPDTPLRFVSFSDQPDYDRELANRRIPIVFTSDYLLSHDYGLHVVGFKILAERGEFTPYADAMKTCFEIIDSKRAPAELRTESQVFKDSFSKLLGEASTHFSWADQGDVISKGVAETKLIELRAELERFRRFERSATSVSNR